MKLGIVALRLRSDVLISGNPLHVCTTWSAYPEAHAHFIGAAQQAVVLNCALNMPGSVAFEPGREHAKPEILTLQFEAFEIDIGR